MHYIVLNGLTLFTVSASPIAVTTLRNGEDTLRTWIPSIEDWTLSYSVDIRVDCALYRTCIARVKYASQTVRYMRVMRRGVRPMRWPMACRAQIDWRWTIVSTHSFVHSFIQPVSHSISHSDRNVAVIRSFSSPWLISSEKDLVLRPELGRQCGLVLAALTTDVENMALSIHTS